MANEIQMEWLDVELKELNEKQPSNYERLPTLKMEENRLTEIEVDFSKPFEKWIDNSKTPAIIKKIIPVMHDGVRKNWWLSVKNPIFKEVLEQGAKGNSKMKIMQTGREASTRYILVK